MRKFFGGMIGVAGLVLTANGAHTHIFLPPASRPELDIRPVDVWSLVPTRIASRLFGAVADHEISSPLIREAVYGAWCNVFDVEQSDMDRPLNAFSSLGEFFQRPLKIGVRPIDTSCALVSPADCKVLTVGCTQDDIALQVKGLPYSLSALMGTASAPAPGCSTHYCVLYLAPGDYHRFHSPASVNLLKTTHFAGELLPVNPRVACKVPSLFVRNERACVLGTWTLKGMEGMVPESGEDGEGLKFGMAAVAAYNVGGITLDCNPALRSNTSEDDSRFDGGSVRSVIDLKPHVPLSAGDMSGEKLRVGQALGRIDPAFAATAAAK